MALSSNKKKMRNDMKALESDSPLIVYVDIKSPYAFVALEPTFALEQRLGYSFDWRPLTLDIPSYAGSARKEKGKVVESNRSPKKWLGIKYAYMDARRYAERQGHKLYGTEKIWDSSLANIGILWVTQRQRGKLRDYFDAVYPPFWQRNLDIEDISVVSACLNAAGVETKGFEIFCEGEGREIHDDLQSQLHPNGIYGVPTYVFENEILFGRENLPYVEWRLSGCSGAAPDIGNAL
jgi:2-hydroxychromene-2-carboxylate isomerase